MQRVEEILAWLASIPDWTLYLVLGIAAALENLIPPIPADVSVLAGGVIAGLGGADPTILFLVVWLSNVSSALFVYAMGRRHGPRFFDGRVGRFLLAPAQLHMLAAAYRRFGFPIILFSRFLPVFRPVVPAFAGLTHVGFWRTAIPIFLASALWYGVLVFAGSMAGANWRTVVSTFADAGAWLWIVAAVLLVPVAVWWWRTRSNESADTRS